MQQCKFCGAYFVEKSLTCSRCGRVQPQAPQFAPLGEETSGGHVPVAQGGSLAPRVQRTQQESRQFQPYHHPYLPPQRIRDEAGESQTGQEVPALRHKERGTYLASAVRKIAAPKWIMVAIAALVIAGGVGVFALVAQSAGTGGSPTKGTHLARTPKGASAMPSCSASGSHTGAFTFTGVVAGAISLATFEACNSAAPSCSVPCSYTSEYGNTTYFGRAQGKIGGVTYRFEFLINPYAGPGRYTSTGSTNVVLMRDNYEWETYGAASNRTSIVVKAAGKTGSIRATISMMSPEFDPTSMVTVTGNWSQ